MSGISSRTFWTDKPTGTCLKPKGFALPNNLKPGSLDVGSHRVGQNVDLIFELAEPFDNLSNGDWSAAVLIEWLGCNN